MITDDVRDPTHGELLMLGFEVAQSTVSKYLVRGGPRSQGWKTFIRNHAQAVAAIDLCVVPTLTFERLFAFLVLGHDRRQLLWFEVTRHPTAEWLARQITEAFPWASAPTYLVHDNDRVYGHVFMATQLKPIVPEVDRSPAEQKKRRALLADLTNKGIFIRAELPDNLPRLWVGPAFHSLELHTKETYVSIVHAYYLDASDQHASVRIFDGRTNKEIGDFTLAAGLKLNPAVGIRR